MVDYLETVVASSEAVTNSSVSSPYLHCLTYGSMFLIMSHSVKSSASVLDYSETLETVDASNEAVATSTGSTPLSAYFRTCPQSSAWPGGSTQPSAKETLCLLHP